jgi:ectoine hydroxylase-related dioxygenase (phytanoyl-CoA dioxygenase family)
VNYLLSDSQCNEFQENGYLIIKNIKEVHEYIELMLSEVDILCANFFWDSSCAQGAEKIAQLSPDEKRTFYVALRYLPSITQLASSPLLLGLSRQLGLEIPAVMHSYNIRMDSPFGDKFLFHWHQDITYLLGSKNSLTYWLPLSPVNEINGSVELIGRTHRSGVSPFHYTGQELSPPRFKSMSPSDIRLDEEPEKSELLVIAEPGDLVIFSQFLLHRSTPNRSNNIRWVAQIRHSDLADQEFRDAGYPFGDITNIFETNHLKIGKNND